MRVLTNIDGDLLSQYDKIDESEEYIENTSLHHHLTKDHNVAANKGKIEGQLRLEHDSGFCKLFSKKVLNN